MGNKWFLDSFSSCGYWVIPQETKMNLCSVLSVSWSISTNSCSTCKTRVRNWWQNEDIFILIWTSTISLGKLSIFIFFRTIALYHSRIPKERTLLWTDVIKCVSLNLSFLLPVLFWKFPSGTYFMFLLLNILLSFTWCKKWYYSLQCWNKYITFV